MNIPIDEQIAAAKNAVDAYTRLKAHGRIVGDDEKLYKFSEVCNPQAILATLERVKAAEAGLPVEPTIEQLLGRHFKAGPRPDWAKSVKAANTNHAKEWLCKVQDFGGFDGYGLDEWMCRIAKTIENLEIALNSQIEITNNERQHKEKIERELDTLRAYAVHCSSGQDTALDIAAKYLKRAARADVDNPALRESVAAIAAKIKPPFAMCYDEKNQFKLELSYQLTEAIDQARTK